MNVKAKYIHYVNNEKIILYNGITHVSHKLQLLNFRFSEFIGKLKGRIFGFTIFCNLVWQFMALMASKLFSVGYYFLNPYKKSFLFPGIIIFQNEHLARLRGIILF